MNIDDITFSMFVNNSLATAKMLEVEKELISSNEADAAIMASRVNYAVNKKHADDLLGIDREFEKFILEKARNESSVDSIDADNILNRAIMNNNFTKDDVLAIQELAKSFNDSYDSALSFEENLTNFYLAQRPGTFPEDAKSVADALRTGVNTFNSRLQKALSEEGFDYAAELKNMTADMSNKDKYELYINFLAALQTISIDNLSPEQASQIESYQTIRNRLIVTDEVTEDMLAEAEALISKTLENNTLCMDSIESLKELISELPNGEQTVEGIVTGCEEDMREKLIAAMTTYVAYENDQIESMRGQQLTPEMIAVYAAAGVEELHVMEDLHSGRTTVDRAIKILKFIGGVALYTLLGYIALIGSLSIGILTLVSLIAALGTSTAGIIGAFVAATFVSLSIIRSTISVGDKVIGWSSRLFDITVGVWRETVWPATKNAIENICSWFASLFQNGVVVEQDQQDDDVLVIENA